MKVKILHRICDSLPSLLKGYGYDNPSIQLMLDEATMGSERIPDTGEVCVIHFPTAQLQHPGIALGHVVFWFSTDGKFLRMTSS
jgi:hypothetical protein